MKAARKKSPELGSFIGARSVCYCGHTGDVELNDEVQGVSQHAGMVGHGKCLAPGCRCNKFTWSMYMPEFAAFKKRASK